MTTDIVDENDKDYNLISNAYSESNLRDSVSSKSEEEVQDGSSVEVKECKVDNWVSPSDTLIKIVKLKAPFTTKIVRAKAHKGLLAIGDGILQAEYQRFREQLKALLDENDAAWQEILDHEQAQIRMKVQCWYEDIFKEKANILMQEVGIFYEKSLQELENHLRSEIERALVNLRAAMVTDLNIQIKNKLSHEKKILENVLKKKFLTEFCKVKRYYNLLLHNETDRCKKLINAASAQRNDAIQALFSQLNAENFTSCMYVMSTERKKCRIQKFFLESHIGLDIVDHLQKLVDKEDCLKELKKGEKTLSEVNMLWEDKVGKILEIFTKFISFSMKLLPEQTNFLLQLEKLIVLQLHEIQKTPQKVSSILVEEEEIENAFKFPTPEIPQFEYKDPFILEGDTEIPAPKVYGSRETLPSDVELPFIVVDKEYIFAKCHKFEEIKEFIECQYSKPVSRTSQHSLLVEEKPVPRSLPSSFTWSEPEQECELSTKSTFSSWTDSEEEYVITSSSSSPSTPHVAQKTRESPPSTPSSSVKSQSDVILRSETCPARACTEWIKKQSFPYLNTYLDFSEQNYARVQAIVDKNSTIDSPQLIKASKLARTKLPFAQTDERTYDAATQISSDDDLLTVPIQKISCTCLQDIHTNPCNIGESPQQLITEVLTRREQSIYNLMNTHPELLKLFDEEKYDYKFLKL